MLVRDAEERDLPQIVELVNALLETTSIEWTERPYTVEDRRSWLQAHQRAGECVLVAVRAGEVLGFASYGDFRDSRKWPGYRFTVEHTIHVSQAHWGAGVGRHLLEALSARAAAAGKHVMVAAIDGDNTGSIAFHLRCGFREVGRLPEVGWKLGRRRTLVLLQREL
jgi:L-amino acid N-acyltransferase YncA